MTSIVPQIDPPPTPSKLLSRYGPWAVITGASDGIGREFAFRLAQAGFNLVLVARRRAALEAVAMETTARYGVENRVLSVDLGGEESVESIQMQTSDLDVGLLVAAAGFGTSGRLIDAHLEHETDMLNVNCRAVLELSSHFGRRLAGRGRGAIILLSSLVGFQGTPYAANYSATKAYVQTLAEALHAELGSLGVDVLASAPGPVHSGFATRAGMQMNLALKPEEVVQNTLNALGRKTTVVPGLLSKFLTYSLLPLPRPVRTRIMGRIMRGMTRHRDGAIPRQNPKPA
jgi:short-subunit dehydrogenase